MVFYNLNTFLQQQDKTRRNVYAQKKNGPFGIVLIPSSIIDCWMWWRFQESNNGEV